VHVLIGNHDVQLLAAYRFGGEAVKAWLEAGGVQADLDGLTELHAGWLGGLPAQLVVDDLLLQHADARFYAAYGATVDEVNAGFRDVLRSSERTRWDRLLDQFGEHRAFYGDDGRANLHDFLSTFGGQRLIHAHTPISRMLRIPPEVVTAPYMYCGGLCVNVDPGIYLGGPGFAFRAR